MPRMNTRTCPGKHRARTDVSRRVGHAQGARAMTDRRETRELRETHEDLPPMQAGRRFKPILARQKILFFVVGRPRADASARASRTVSRIREVSRNQNSRRQRRERDQELGDWSCTFREKFGFGAATILETH